MSLFNSFEKAFCKAVTVFREDVGIYNSTPPIQLIVTHLRLILPHGSIVYGSFNYLEIV